MRVEINDPMAEEHQPDGQRRGPADEDKFFKLIARLSRSNFPNVYPVIFGRPIDPGSELEPMI
jgi:hypothetical protein